MAKPAIKYSDRFPEIQPQPSPGLDGGSKPVVIDYEAEFSYANNVDAWRRASESDRVSNWSYAFGQFILSLAEYEAEKGVEAEMGVVPILGKTSSDLLNKGQSEKPTLGLKVPIIADRASLDRMGSL